MAEILRTFVEWCKNPRKPDDRDSPCPNCDEGEMKCISVNPGGTMIFECDICSHEERFP